MAYASRIINHSKKLKDVSTLLRRENAATIRYYSNTNRAPLNREDTFNSRLGYPPLERISICSTSTLPVSIIFSTTRSNLSSAMGRPIFGKEFSCLMQSARGFSSGSDLPPHQEIGMPSLSPTMTEAWIFIYLLIKTYGNIARWLKKEGDKVAPGEVLCEVETDKATVEMECMEEGYLAKIVKAEGSKEIQVGEVIAITVEDEEDIGKFKDYTPSSTADAAPTKAEPTPAPPKEEKVKQPSSPPEPKASKPSTPPTGDRVFASPLARKLAEDNNVPLSDIEGTGPEGRIVKADIDEYLASSGKGATAKPSKSTDSKAPALDYVDIPHSQIRKVTASRLAFSKQTIPHYYLTVDTCVDKLMALRSQLNSFKEASGGKRISVNDLVVKAAALALRKVPQCNSSWTDDYIRQFKNVNINVAVQTENGLYVPVVKDADRKGLSTIGEEVRLLAQKAKENSLKPEDYEVREFIILLTNHIFQ
ncbi:Dihydrolipoyllysine-residue acetyltransferase component 3 of pyruvate dehydrogenase complex [Arabidopsis thaliana]